ncbi:MAG: YraN family protein [Pirellulaceae bacterium]
MHFLSGSVQSLNLQGFGSASQGEEPGRFGEILAERHLLKQGCFIVGRNQRSRHGEIDLIAVEGKTVLFVEVKTRFSDRAGSAAEAVTEKKEIRISKTAAEYCRHRNLKEVPKRFDVIAIDWIDNLPTIRHFKSAFEYAIDD